MNLNLYNKVLKFKLDNSCPSSPRWRACFIAGLVRVAAHTSLGDIFKEYMNVLFRPQTDKFNAWRLSELVRKRFHHIQNCCFLICELILFHVVRPQSACLQLVERIFFVTKAYQYYGQSTLKAYENYLFPLRIPKCMWDWHTAFLGGWVGEYIYIYTYIFSI